VTSWLLDDDLIFGVTFQAKPSPAKRTAKPNFMAPTAASQTRAIAGSKKGKVTLLP